VSRLAAPSTLATEISKLPSWEALQLAGALALGAMAEVIPWPATRVAARVSTARADENMVPWCLGGNCVVEVETTEQCFRLRGREKTERRYAMPNYGERALQMRKCASRLAGRQFRMEDGEVREGGCGNNRRQTGLLVLCLEATE
jgi:hypothetical protein